MCGFLNITKGFLMSNENTQMNPLKAKLIALKDKFMLADNQMKARILLIFVSALAVIYLGFTVLSSGLVFLIKFALFAAGGWVLYQYGLPYIKPTIDYLNNRSK